MELKTLKERIENLNYPNLTRTLGDLKLVERVEINENKAKVVLSVLSDEAYETLEQTISQKFGDHFDSLDIQKQGAAKKTLNYGNTANPNNRAPYAKNVIAVTSGKGGVGKTTVSVNLAIGLAQKGYKVGLLDADIYGPNVPRLTQTDMDKMKWNDDTNKIIPAENFGIKIMSVAMTTPRSDTPLVWRSSVAISALIQFLEDVEWGELDFLVIDMPPGTGDIQLTMAEELPIKAGLLVTTPQFVSLDDVSRAIMMYKDIGVPIAGLVENMSYFITPDTQQTYDIFGQGGGKRTAEYYQIPFLGEIPLTVDIRKLCDEGTPPIALGDHTLKQHYIDMVENLLATSDFDL